MSILLPKTLILPSIPNGRQLPLPIKAVTSVVVYVRAPSSIGIINDPSVLSVPTLSPEEDLAGMLVNGGPLSLIPLVISMRDDEIRALQGPNELTYGIQLSAQDWGNSGMWINGTIYS